MIRSAARSFPASVYDPPPESNWGAPALNLNLGSVNVSLGGAGTGVYRKSGGGGGNGDSSVVQTEGIRDGVRTFMGKVRQGVDRIGIP
jgi:vacuolar protein sorting-associated protein 45